MDPAGFLATAPVTASGLVLQAHRLVQMLWAACAFFLLAAVMGILAGLWKSALVGLLTLGLLLTALRLAHQGQLQRAAGLMLASLTLSVSYLVTLNHGITGPGITAFPAILLLASMFGTRRVFLTILAFMFAILTALVVANLQGWYVNAAPTVTPRLLILVLAILSMTAFFVWLMATDLRNALLHLKAENERIRESHARIDVLAHHDALTGLPNRTLARDRFEQAIAQAQRNKHGVALIFLDLDDFKTVNDSLGHATGDLLLCEVATRISQAVRASDTVSRQGGDEFLIIMGALTGGESVVATTAVKIIDLLSAPFAVKGVELSVTCSLGVAVYPDNGLDFDTLLKSADVAMYRAKESGHNLFRFFDAQMNRSVVETLQLISGIRSALAKGEFRLHYQPLFELKTGRIVGAEALIRWSHPDLGVIPPCKFIPVAERSGLINGIGAWVLTEACRQAKQWQDAGLEQLIVSVNVSPVQFRRDDIEGEITDALQASTLSPHSIELELTESLLIAESSHLGPLLSRLRALGVRFSIDDFGTGYSNLGYLHRFEVQRIKIDRSFICRLTQDSNDESIVRAIIDMARSLKLEVVAEGIEDLPTLHRLIELGCEYGQGFHWSPALPPDAFFDFFRKHQVA